MKQENILKLINYYLSLLKNLGERDSDHPSTIPGVWNCIKIVMPNTCYVFEMYVS